MRSNGVELSIATGAQKQSIVNSIDVGDRLEADKIDVVVRGREDQRFFGVVNVKASFAERRTDDVSMSVALKEAGYTSPLWTMDCKSTPAQRPMNRGELGETRGRRSAKRKDIEDDGYFTGCFSYNSNTTASGTWLPPDNRIYTCDFNNPDDAFSKFIIGRWQRFARS